MKMIRTILGVGAWVGLGVLLGSGISTASAQNLSLEQEAQKNYPVDYREIGPEDYDPEGLLNSLSATADELERLSGEEARISAEALGDKWQGDPNQSTAEWLDRSRQILSTVGFYQELQERTSDYRDAATKAKIGNLAAAQELAKALEEAQKQKLQTDSFLRGDTRIQDSFSSLTESGVELPEPEGFGTITIQAPVPMQGILVRVLGGRGVLDVNTDDCNRSTTLQVGDYCTLTYSWRNGGPRGISAMILEFVNADSDLRVQVPITVVPFQANTRVSGNAPNSLAGNRQPGSVPSQGGVVPQPADGVVPQAGVVPQRPTVRDPAPEQGVSPESRQPVVRRPVAPAPPSLDIEDFSIPERSVIRFLHKDKARLRIAFGPITDFQGNWQEFDVAIGDAIGDGWRVSRIDMDTGYVTVSNETEQFEIRRKREFRDLAELELGGL